MVDQATGPPEGTVGILPVPEEEPHPSGAWGRRRRRLLAPEGSPGPAGLPWLGRTWWSVAGIVLVVWALRLFGYVDVFPWLGAAVVVIGAWGLATVVVAWLPARPSRRTAAVLAWATVALAVAGLLLWSYVQVYSAPGYGTDEIAFDQYAAHLLVHGSNPYVHSMAPAFSMFHVSPNGYTFHLDGAPVTALSYPALSFELYAPLLALGWTAQAAVGLNVAAWALAMVLAFALLPRQVRPLAIVVASSSVLVGYAVGGVTDALFVPLLLGAAWRWDRFATSRGWRAWLGPCLLGLAMAVKQTPWVVLPFLVAAMVMEGRRLGGWPRGLRTGSRYLAVAVGAFLAPNVAFIVASPHAWLTGVLTPLSSHAVPAGQGLIGLSLFVGLGGGSLVAYTAAAAVVLAALWLAFVATYPGLKAWVFFLPSVVLFFAARSFASYLVTLLLVAIVAAATVRPSHGARPWRRWPMLVGGAGAAGAAAVAAALLVPAPLAVAITSVRTTGQLATVEQLGVRVTNRGSAPARPAFTVESGGTLTAFWSASRGPHVLAPGHSASYTLLAPNFFAQPPITGGFQVVAFTSAPGTVSRSGAYVPTTWHVALVPDAVDHVVDAGQALTVGAEVLDHLDQPVRRAGIPVYLGQIIYAQRGLVYSQAVVNGSPPGQTPVRALTDAQGRATFVIQGTRASADPVYFEANLVNGTQFYPYGYSEILPIRFGGG